ncbi:MAG: class I SAM-dependent methyltransferase, partial [Bryobacteraceae bacterium]
AAGYLAETLAGRGYRVTGVERPGANDDGFPDSVELVEADLEHGLPPLDGRFSYVICGDVLEHVRDPAKLLRGIRNVLAPDGLLLASLPNSGHLVFRLVVLSGHFPQQDRGLFDRTHVRFYMWKGWHDLLDETGFRVENAHPTIPPFDLAFPSWEGTLPLRAAEKLAYLSARVWPTLLAYQFVIQAKVKL